MKRLLALFLMALSPHAWATLYTADSPAVTIDKLSGKWSALAGVFNDIR